MQEVKKNLSSTKIWRLMFKIFYKYLQVIKFINPILSSLTLMWFTHNTKVHLPKIKIFPINLINPYKNKISQALKKEENAFWFTTIPLPGFNATSTW